MEDRRIDVSQPSISADVAVEKQSLDTSDIMSAIEEDESSTFIAPRLPELVFVPLVPFSGLLLNAGPDTYEELHHQISRRMKSGVRRAGTLKRRMTRRGEFLTQNTQAKIRRKPVAAAVIVPHLPSSLT